MKSEALSGTTESSQEEIGAPQPGGAHDRAHQLLLSSLYDRAVEAASSLEWPQAMNLFGRIYKLDRNYRDTRDRLAQAEVQARLALLYSGALEALEHKRWSEAVDALSEIVGIDADYHDAPELLTQAGMALAESKTRDLPARMRSGGVLHAANEEWPKAQARPDQDLEADSDDLDTASPVTASGQHERRPRSILARVSRSLTGWWRAPLETNPSPSEADEAHPADELHPADESRAADELQ